jgi:hypothetical protein
MKNTNLVTALTRLDTPGSLAAYVASGWLAQYCRGFVDSYTNHPYHWVLLYIKYPIFVPRSDPYRQGYLDGLTARWV